MSKTESSADVLDEILPPPPKRRRISPIYSESMSTSHTPSKTSVEPFANTTNLFPLNADKLQTLEDEFEDDGLDEEEFEDDDESGGYYSLHIEPDIILSSTDRRFSVNVDWQFDDEKEPNLFLVKDGDNDYNADEWLAQNGDSVTKAAQLLLKTTLKCNSKEAIPLLIVTGAGMGRDSGLPDYRSKNGFWRDYPPFRNSKLSLYEMSQSDWFLTDPETAWGFYTHRTKLYRDSIPHKGFEILKQLCTDRQHFVMTSNIDGQMTKAGYNESRIWETHGSLSHIQCSRMANCKGVDILEWNTILNIDKSTFKVKQKSTIPVCNDCNCLMRPNVSFMTDTYLSFNAERSFEQKKRCMHFLSQFIHISNMCDYGNADNNADNVTTNTDNTADNTAAKNRYNEGSFIVKDLRPNLIVIELGCGTSLHSLRWEVQYLSTFANVSIIRINPSDAWSADISTDKNDSRHVGLKLPAKMALEAIWKEMERLKCNEDS